ncbi:MAG: glycoside hydrolase family 16 protein [Burkholderiales bacterium]
MTDESNRHAAAPASRRQLLQRLIAAAGWAAASGCATPATSTQRPGDDARPPAAPAAIRDQGYRLVQDWDFARTVTDDQKLRDAFFTRYIYEGGKLDHLGDEWQRYRDNDNHVFEDGALALVARVPAGMTSGKIESGMLRSKWSGRYGYFECRMKVPGARGLWPAFWLNPQDAKWPPEIDIVEIVNDGRAGSRGSYHFLHGGVKEAMPTTNSLLDKSQAYKPGIDYQDDFHTFAAEWTAHRVRHFVDDVLVVERGFHWTHQGGADAGPAHVLLNLAVGGGWPGAPVDPGAFPAKLLVKHIRVWQR